MSLYNEDKVKKGIDNYYTHIKYYDRVFPIGSDSLFADVQLPTNNVTPIGIKLELENDYYGSGVEMSNPWKAIVLFLFIFILIEVIKTDFREERIKTLEDSK